MNKLLPTDREHSEKDVLVAFNEVRYREWKEIQEVLTIARLRRDDEHSRVVDAERRGAAAATGHRVSSP